METVPERRKIAALLAHSLETQNKYYVANALESEVVEGFDLLENAKQKEEVCL